MEVVKNFKFASNLEYVSEMLGEKKIKHYPDFETRSLLCENKDKVEVLNLIEKLNIDENEVEIDDEVLEGYKEWNDNMYNPGYFTGGKTPFFQKEDNNYLAYGFIVLVSGLACLVEELYSEDFSKVKFWGAIIITIFFSGVLFYQYFKRKK